MWALGALVAILLTYLLPLLIGTRQALGYSRVADRYSSQLRLLATADDYPTAETCVSGGRAEIFRQRPEVTIMNRPAVRNVRALRAERELVRAQRAHAQGQENRRLAAARRAIVACALLGVLLGVAVVAAVTVMPWWPVAIPTALLAVSMVAGRHASVAGAQADHRERRRIAAIEVELQRLTGRVVGEGEHDVRKSVADDLAVETDVRTAVKPEALAAATSVEMLAVDEHDATTGEGASGGVTSRVADSVPVAKERHSFEAGERERHVASAARATETDEEREATTRTPPQGWEPVSVPAPSYTLVARASKRVIEELELPEGPSAPVPMRPTSVRTFVAHAPESEHRVDAPIDLDEVLQRRRAAGA